MEQAKQSTTWHRFALPLVALFCVGYAAWRMWPHTLDDAYISMQYARQWLAGNGLVFTQNSRVEGFSNPLWVALLALGGLFGAAMPTTARALGLASSLATVAVLWFGVHRLAPTPPSPKKKSKAPKENKHLQWLDHWALAPGIAVLLLASHPGVGYYSTAGLETSLYGLLLSLGLVGHVLSLQPEAPSRWQNMSLLSLALAAITRPEGPMFLLLAMAHTVWHRAHMPPAEASLVHRLKDATHANALRFGTALGLPLSYLIFRVFYYGTWAPNTFFAKPGMFFTNPGLGWDYVVGFLRFHTSAAPGWSGPLLLLFQSIALLFGALLLWLTFRAIRHHRSVAGVLALFVLAQLGFVMYASGDWMIQYRLIQPMLPLIYALPALGLATLPSPRQRIISLVLLGLLLSHSQHIPAMWKTLEANQDIDHAHSSQNNIKAARWMAKHLKPGSSLVTDEVGAFGFYTKLRIIDQWGLVDKPIAQILTKLRFNPNISGKPTPLRAKAQQQIVTEMMRRKPTHVLIDYRGKISASGQFDPRYINRLTMPQLYRAIQADYVYVRAFALMKGKRNKFFLLFRRKAGR